MFVDRKEEILVLEKEYMKASSFVVIYGRRRTGKTTLIEKFIENRSALYFLATEEPEVIQRRRFQRLLFDYTGDRVLSNFDQPLDWESLFIIFSRQSGKKILVMDEFQYLATVNPAFPSVFQLVWDRYLKESNTMVILCGSLITMMLGQVLRYSSPLYGRRTAQILLKPLSFESYGKFFDFDDKEKLLEFYSITGGIPKYIEEARSFEDPIKFIVEAILDKDSYLYREPFFLLEKETNAVGTYMSIIAQIADGKNRIGEIASAFNSNPSHFTRYLKVLRDLDFVERMVSVTEKNPERSKKGIYLIKDRFLNFWFQYVFPFLGYLEIRKIDPALRSIKNTFRSVLVPLVYEALCREATNTMAARGELPFVPEKIGKWWDRKNDVDIVGISKDKIITGECKYTSSPMDTKSLYLLEKRTEMIAQGKEPFYILFSKSGFTSELQEISRKKDNIKLITFLPD
ncbi:hypothetical protein AT15_01900 [Kosmotoga arenicorallina S304]|uniref:ATPase n=1 Tax=Kosmotoga arenicorallina S304 TaxID=1453497 RepID=A0A176K014_9BACT|nr:ATP-binding protein [Kosmotoga arenicorallina]OAA29450.1 hypothetical protein AT15_01900 [Kosmotoga arenicorallina S304]